MKPTTAILALSLLAPLPACSSLQAVGAGSTPISSVAPAEFAKAKQALTSAHLVHKTVADFLVIAANSDLCKAACAVQAKTLLDQSEAVLQAADAAVATGDAKSIEDKIASATALTGQLQTLIGRH